MPPLSTHFGPPLPSLRRKTHPPLPARRPLQVSELAEEIVLLLDDVEGGAGEEEDLGAAAVALGRRQADDRLGAQPDVAARALGDLDPRHAFSPPPKIGTS